MGVSDLQEKERRSAYFTSISHRLITFAMLALYPVIGSTVESEINSATTYTSKHELNEKKIVPIEPFHIEIKKVTESEDQAVVKKSTRPIMVYGIHSDFRFTSGGTTQYNELMDRLVNQGLSFRLRIRSARRSHRSFMNNTSSCIFPANARLLKDLPGMERFPNLLVSDPVDRYKVGIFTASGTHRISSLSELNNKRVALWGRGSLLPILDSFEYLEEVIPSESVRLKMLNAGRIDAIIGRDKNVYITAKALGITPPIFDANLSFFNEGDASLVCHDNEKSREFFSGFQKAIHSLLSSGEMDIMLSKEAY